MSIDATAESSTVTPVEDLFYGNTETSKPESTPGHEEETSSSAEPEEGEETASASEAEEQEQTEESIETPEKPPAVKPRTNAEKRIAELLAENKRLKQQQPAPKVEAPKVETPKPETKVEELKAPTPGEFETWDAYQKAHGDFVKKQIEAETKRAIEADRAERDKQSREAEAKDASKKAFDAWTKQVETGVKRHPDFKSKVYDGEGNLKADVPLNDAFDNLIPRSPVGYEILYHLATLPADEAAAIRGMQGYEAQRFAFQLEAQVQESLKTPPKKTNLRPPRQVNGSGTKPVSRSAEEVFYGSD